MVLTKQTSQFGKPHMQFCNLPLRANAKAMQTNSLLVKFLVVCNTVEGNLTVSVAVNWSWSEMLLQVILPSLSPSVLLCP